MGFYKAKQDEVTYEVKEKLGVISSNGKTTRELRLVSWNGNEPKYDIRPWGVKEDGTEVGYKGATFTGEELENLYNILKGIAEDDQPKAKGRK